MNGTDDNSKCIYIAPTKVNALSKHYQPTEVANTRTGPLFREIQGLVPKVSKHRDQVYAQGAILISPI